MITRDSETRLDVSFVVVPILLPLLLVPLSRLKKSGTRERRNFGDLPFVLLSALTGDSFESAVQLDVTTQRRTRGYANTRVPNASRYVKRTRSTHSRPESGVVSPFYLYLFTVVFGQRKHGE